MQQSKPLGFATLPPPALVPEIYISNLSHSVDFLPASAFSGFFTRPLSVKCLFLLPTNWTLSVGFKTTSRAKTYRRNSERTKWPLHGRRARKLVSDLLSDVFWQLRASPSSGAAVFVSLWKVFLSLSCLQSPDRLASSGSHIGTYKCAGRLL